MSSYHRYEDDDESRLPEGFERVGYDADTEVYTYRSAQGELYKGAPGNRYGKLVPVSEPADDGFEAPVYDNATSYRYFLPFLLLVIVFLLILIAPPWRQNFGAGRSVTCQTGSMKHEIASGETCYALSQKYSTTVKELKDMNLKLNCDNLQIGQVLCVPVADAS